MVASLARSKPTTKSSILFPALMLVHSVSACDFDDPWGELQLICWSSPGAPVVESAPVTPLHYGVLNTPSVMNITA